MGLRVDVVADRGGDSDTGFVGQRLIGRHGAEIVLHDRDALPGLDALDGGLVLLLGSERSAHDPAQRSVVDAESALVRDRLDAGVPVLGICYGAQLLAHALGGSVHPAARDEVGLYAVESADAQLCPAGPWSQFHFDAFTPPPGARVLGTSPAGCQGFADTSRRARALGWQFHPEVTPERFAIWVGALGAQLQRRGFDPEALIRQVSEQADRLRDAAYALSDHAVDWLLG